MLGGSWQRAMAFGLNPAITLASFVQVEIHPLFQHIEQWPCSIFEVLSAQRNGVGGPAPETGSNGKQEGV